MKQTKKLLAVLLVLCMIFTLTCTALAVEGDASMAGKTVILHSNDVHGNLEGYAKMAALRDEYASKGAEVILADCGDFIQGTTYVSLSKGANAVKMMNEVGYDVATFGNHEFDFGYENLMNILQDAKFKVICGDVMKDGKTIVDGTLIIEKGGVKVGFFGLETPETYTKVNPGLIQGLSFLQKEELYKCAQSMVDQLKADGADVIVGLVHLGMDAESAGNQSKDVMEHVTGIDMLLDGHSHTVMTPGVAEFKTGVDEEGNDVTVANPCPDLPIQSTGTKFAYIGVVVIDGASKKIESQTLVSTADIPDNEAVLAKAKELEKAVDDEYGAAFAKSDVDLNGAKAPGNRTEETNLGDLICDAMLWTVLKDASELKVPVENVVALTNGGGIRAPIAKGDVTMKDINTVLPFGNTVAVVYVTGAELLEALEASLAFVPDAVGGFPQTAGMQITVNIDEPFNQGDQYPGSTYYAPKTIDRTIIESVNGYAFDPDATYAVVTNNFCAAGGDTYYAFKAASDQFDTSIPLDEALVSYIQEVLGGVIGEQYAEPQGRMFIGTAEELAIRNMEMVDEALVNFVEGNKDAYTPETLKAFEDAQAAFEKAEGTADKGKALKAVQEAAQKLAFKDSSFKDVNAEKDWFAPAVKAANALGLMKGTDKDVFDPAIPMNRAMVATVLYRMAGEPSVEGMTCPFTDLTQDWYKNAVIWCSNAGVTNGKTETTFCPNDPITREQMATMMVRYLFGSMAGAASDDTIKEVRAELAKIYADAASINDWAVMSVAYSYDLGLMKGDTGSFYPQRTLTRAECAQILANLHQTAIDSLTETGSYEPQGGEEANVQALWLPAA